MGETDMVIKSDIFFTPFGAKRGLHIWLPDEYENTDERYPVMYCFDGHNLFFDEDATYGKSWGLQAFLRRWEKPMIVVGMECGHEGQERLVEYCPYHYSGHFWGDVAGRGDETMRFIVQTLKPMIDSTYRTYPFREATGIGGSSMGGLMSLYAVIRYNRWFSKAACLSSAIGPGMRELSRDVQAAALSPDTRVYLSWGTREAGGPHGMGACSREIARQLDARGVRTRLRCLEGGRHCEADWEKLVPEWMDYLWLDR